MSGHYDPRDFAESPDELARDVLDPEEYAEWRRDSADRARLRSLAKKHRDERMRVQPSTFRDPWADPHGGGAA